MADIPLNEPAVPRHGLRSNATADGDALNPRAA